MFSGKMRCPPEIIIDISKTDGKLPYGKVPEMDFLGWIWRLVFWQVYFGRAARFHLSFPNWIEKIHFIQYYIFYLILMS